MTRGNELEIIKEVLRDLDLNVTDVEVDNDDEEQYILATKITFPEIKLKMYNNIDVFEDCIIINFFDISYLEEETKELDKEAIFNINENLRVGRFGVDYQDGLTYRSVIFINENSNFNKDLFKLIYLVSLKNISGHSVKILG